MKRIKWKNLLVMIALIISLIVVLHDAYYLTIYSTITGNLYSFSWYGLITFIVAIGIGGASYVYLFEK